MGSRPYLRCKIEELEALYAASKRNPNTLDVLLFELKHRGTPRAKKLRSLIEKERAVSSPEITGISQPKANTYPTPKPPRPTASTGKAEDSTVPEMHAPVRGRPEESLSTPTKTCIAAEADSVPSTACGSTASVPDKVLTTWLTLEVLTPQPLPAKQDLALLRRTLVRLDEVPEPWQHSRFMKRGKESVVYWMVYLGEICLDKALQSILQAFPDEASDERAEIHGSTTLAVVVLDAHGCPIPDSIFLSSFAWAYGKLQAGQFSELAGFADAERTIRAEIKKRIARQGEDGTIQPVLSSDLARLTDWLVKTLTLPREEVLQPGIAVRVPKFGAYNEAPEPELLNSFFLEDLIRTRSEFRQSRVGRALSAYLNAAEARPCQDVVQDKSLLAKTLAPERLPLIRWPERGRCSLFLMQQAAVNHAIGELADGGLIAVNGPPGTGKTTLLRDIVAKVVLDRAIALARFEDPALAFKHVAPIRLGSAFLHLYKLHDSLLGHEIVVASSNNKAVENISRELPSASAVADDFDPPLTYFQSISDSVAAGDEEIRDGTTWGLAAAVLGNAANRSAFQHSFWWHDQRGMRLYLQSVNELEAQEQWRKARKDFLAKLKRVQDLRRHAEDAYAAVCRKPEVVRQLDLATIELAEAKQDVIAAEEQAHNAAQLYEQALNTERNLLQDRSALESMRPELFARLLNLRSYRTWQQRIASATDTISEVREAIKSAEKQAKNLWDALARARARVAELETKKAGAEKLCEKTFDEVRAGHDLIGPNFAHETFWSQADEIIQIASPWTFPDLQRARDELFVATFQLHHAFVHAAAKYFRHNLAAVLALMKGRTLSANQEPARRSLWASLFLVVPVVSTTFASVSRLFGSLGSEQLGWLLVDEAGQATPQAAVGALWRARRAIVIGDPLQIQPVVTIPPKLINVICRQFGIESDNWVAPSMSAQTLADRASWFGTTLTSVTGQVWVGAPLRVHRRCEEPMFSISNKIAYNGLMVYGTSSGTSSIGELLGPSMWIHTSGDASGKWSQTEGTIVMDMLSRLLDAGIENPDLFIITPFRMVSLKLREMVRADRRISERLPQKAWQWSNERIGTIHTFQGREADTVILVLGASLDGCVGARRWAGESPHLLNVAVTRAKRRLYVVGNHKAWGNIGCFQHLANSVKVLGATCG